MFQGSPIRPIGVDDPQSPLLKSFQVVTEVFWKGSMEDGVSVFQYRTNTCEVKHGEFVAGPATPKSHIAKKLKKSSHSNSDYLTDKINVFAFSLKTALVTINQI